MVSEGKDLIMMDNFSLIVNVSHTSPFFAPLAITDAG